MQSSGGEVIYSLVNENTHQNLSFAMLHSHQFSFQRIRNWTKNDKNHSIDHLWYWMNIYEQRTNTFFTREIIEKSCQKLRFVRESDKSSNLKWSHRSQCRYLPCRTANLERSAFHLKDSFFHNFEGCFVFLRRKCRFELKSLIFYWHVSQ